MLAHLEERAPPPVVDEHALEHVVEVVRLARHELVVPRQLAGLGIQRQHAVRVERVAVGGPRYPRPRLGLRGRPVGEVGLGVEGARYPGVRAGPIHQRQVAPGVAARLARLGDRRRAPDLVAGLGVVGGDEADIVLVVLAAGHARHDSSLHDDGTAAVPVAERTVGHRVVPGHLAGLRVEGHDVGVGGVQIDLVAVEGDGAGAAARAAVRTVLAPFIVPRVLPEAFTSRRVHGLDAVAGVRDVHHPVVDEGGRLAEPGPIDQPQTS